MTHQTTVLVSIKPQQLHLTLVERWPAIVVLLRVTAIVQGEGILASNKSGFLVYFINNNASSTALGMPLRIDGSHATSVVQANLAQSNTLANSCSWFGHRQHGQRRYRKNGCIGFIAEYSGIIIYRMYMTTSDLQMETQYVSRAQQGN